MRERPEEDAARSRDGRRRRSRDGMRLGTTSQVLPSARVRMLQRGLLNAHVGALLLPPCYRTERGRSRELEAMSEIFDAHPEAKKWVLGSADGSVLERVERG